jgi:hypothetical protein
MRPSNCVAAGLAILLLAAQAAADDAPEIAVEAGASEIFIGESVDYAVELRNVKDPSPPDLSALRPDFEVVSQAMSRVISHPRSSSMAGSRSRTRSGTSIASA